MYIRPFDIQADTVNQVVGITSTALQINATPIGNRSVRIANVGTQTVFIKFGTSTVTVTATNGIPIFANTSQTFLIDNDTTHVASIAGAAGSTLYATLGEGA